MKNMMQALVVSALILTVVGCGGRDSVTERAVSPQALADQTVSAGQHFVARVEWLTPVPGVEQEGRARITFSNPRGNDVQAKDVRVVLWMPAHGHPGEGTPAVAQSANAANGVFEVSHIIPTMSGSWELKIDAVFNGHPDQAKFTFIVPKVAR